MLGLLPYFSVGIVIPVSGLPPRALDRRRLLQMALATTLFPAGAAQAGPQAMHSQIADHVLRITANKRATLRLLLPDGSEGNLRPIIQKFQDMTGVQIHVHQTDVDGVNAELMLDTLSKSGNFRCRLAGHLWPAGSGLRPGNPAPEPF